MSIAREIESHFLGDHKGGSEFFVFLCGGTETAQEQMRRAVGGELSSVRSKYRYVPYYPEDMFVEMILGHARRDLLSLENMLAQSVHVVAILLSGPGTFTELGAFANHPVLKDKLILLIIRDMREQRVSSISALSAI